MDDFIDDYTAYKPDMSPKILVFFVSACLFKDAFYTDAAPSIGFNELTVLPRTLAELVDSEAFERVWRDAAAEQIVARFSGVGRDGPVTRNMIGDYMMSDEFHQGLCKGGNQGMTSMGGMMGSAPPPWSYMGTFIGSEKFQHGTCDMMSQGMSQFGEGINGFRSADGDAAAAADDDVQDPVRPVDAFFRSEQYKNTREQLRNMFSDVRF